MFKFMPILLLFTCLAESADRDPSFYREFIDIDKKHVAPGNNYFYPCLCCGSYIQKSNIVGHYNSRDDDHKDKLTQAAAFPEYKKLYEKLLERHDKRRKYFQKRSFDIRRSSSGVGPVVKKPGRGTGQAGAGQTVVK